ncbi:MAG: hypothetical protein RR636_06720 [Clostridium sp.]|uniref:hypothetical protein n=1 Tax=Clostridium sp. TaxID=1506 RepID=UPI00306C16C0
MRVKCNNYTGSSLSTKALDASGTIGTEFELTINQEYVVYGIMLWEGVPKYLIIGNENLASWYPAELFEVVDNCLPLEWYFNYYSGESLEAIWGYKEMVMDEAHYDELIEWEDEAVKIFLKRKNEIDEMLNY